MKFEDYLVEKAREDGIEKLVVGGVVRENGKYLILSRKQDDFMGGIDEIPSGKMEKDETLFEALIREIKEETNLDVKYIESYIDYFDYLSNSGKKSRQYNFVVKVKNIDNIRLTEHDEHKWQNINECRLNKKITPKTLNTINIAEYNNTENFDTINNYDSIINFVAKELAFDKSGHGLQHAMRVFNNAKKILKNENGDEKIVLTSALIHDTVDKKLFNNFDERIKYVKNFLKENNYTEKEIDEIAYIISNISWNNGENKELVSDNAKIVRDADRLDAIGAMGIIRTIEFGSSRNRQFYENENIKIVDNKYEFNQPTQSTLSHFYEKLLLLKNLLHTNTAKIIAEKRHAFMEKFLQEFYDEL